MTSLLLALLFNSVLLAICIYALVWGGTPERIGAIVNLAASVVSTALRVSDLSFFAPTSIIMLAIDLAVAGSFFFLAARTTRFWPIWAFGFALADIVMSIAGTLLPRAPLFAFQSGLVIYAYLALAALAVGTYRLPRDATPDQRRGNRPPWKSPTQT